MKTVFLTFVVLVLASLSIMLASYALTCDQWILSESESRGSQLSTSTVVVHSSFELMTTEKISSRLVWYATIASLLLSVLCSLLVVAIVIYSFCLLERIDVNKPGITIHRHWYFWTASSGMFSLLSSCLFLLLYRLFSWSEMLDSRLPVHTWSIREDSSLGVGYYVTLVIVVLQSGILCIIPWVGDI